MHELSRQILADWQVRKTGRQKAAFRAFLSATLQAEGYVIREEKSSIIGSVNMVIGDVDRAEVIYTAHYDTCAQLPVPNLIAPKNLLVTLGYQLFLVIIIFLFVFLVSFLAGLVTGLPKVAGLIGAAAAILLTILMLCGPANKHTANDNTSGVITLVETMLALPEADKDRAAFVFFDNEEIGVMGSAFFRSKHARVMRNKLLINFDCVSDGDHMLFVCSKALWKNADLHGRVGSALVVPEGKTKELVPASRAFYPSDQMGFPLSIGVAALKYGRGVGHYLDRIHTSRDTVFDEENIRVLRDFAVRFVAQEERPACDLQAGGVQYE